MNQSVVLPATRVQRFLNRLANSDIGETNSFDGGKVLKLSNDGFELALDGNKMVEVAPNNGIVWTLDELRQKLTELGV